MGSEDKLDKFGSFILHAAVDFENSWKNALLMLSYSSESSSVSSECLSSSESWYFEFSGLWSIGLNRIGLNGVCAKCNDLDDLCRHCYPFKQFYRGVSNIADQPQPQQLQQLVLKLDNIGFPSCYQQSVVTVVGSCNGFICLSDEQPLRFSLWNPTTRQFKILRRPRTIAAGYGSDGQIHRLSAFGFDAETKDYKVVLLSFFNRKNEMLNSVRDGPMECVCHVQVYSLSTDSWRPLKNITTLPASPSPYSYPPNSSSPGLFYLNGTCFFTAKFLYSSERTTLDMANGFLISLDLTKEIVTPIELPSQHPGQKLLYLCYFGEKIACFTQKLDCGKVNDPDGSWDRFDIHVFNEQRSKWIYFVDFQIQLGLSGERNIPIGISNDGVFALLETEICCGGLGNGINKKKKYMIKLYNLITKELKGNFIYCDQVLSKAYAYKPSLVSIAAVTAAAATAAKAAATAAEAAAAADDMVIGTAAGATEMDWIGNAAAA